MRDTLYSSLRAVPSVAPVVINADGATAGTAVSLNLNRQNFRTAMLVVHSGVITDGTYAVTVEESADGTSGWTAVSTDPVDGRLMGSLPTLDLSDSGAAVFEVGIIVNPAMPFLRAVVTAATTTVGGAIGALFLLGTPGQEPVIR